MAFGCKIQNSLKKAKVFTKLTLLRLHFFFFFWWWQGCCKSCSHLDANCNQPSSLFNSSHLLAKNQRMTFEIRLQFAICESDLRTTPGVHQISHSVKGREGRCWCVRVWVKYYHYYLLPSFTTPLYQPPRISTQSFVLIPNPGPSSS